MKYLYCQDSRAVFTENHLKATDCKSLHHPVEWDVAAEDAKGLQETKRLADFLVVLADGGKLTVNGIPWREAYKRVMSIIDGPVEVSPE